MSNCSGLKISEQWIALFEPACRRSLKHGSKHIQGLAFESPPIPARSSFAIALSRLRAASIG